MCFSKVNGKSMRSVDVSGLFTITISGLKLFTMIYRGIVPPFKDMPERSAYIDIFFGISRPSCFCK